MLDIKGGTRRNNIVMRAFSYTCALFLCGTIGALATDSVKTVKAEAPLVVTSGYSVDGLVLWLAADSGVTKDATDNVRALADKTGNFILSTNNPDREPAFVANGLNGHPVLRFSPDQALYTPDDFGTDLDRDMTIILVTKTNAARTFFQYPLYLGQNATSHANRALAYYEGREVFDGQWVGCYGPPVARNTFIVTGVSINPTLTQATFYRNGAQLLVSGLSDEHPKATFESLSPGITLGAASDPCRGWLGDIAEVLVFDRQLAPAEMHSIWVSLAQKYGLRQATAVAAETKN
jgi:hypothetical protein